MPRYTSANHPLVNSVAWDPARGAERINDFILMSRGTSNGYVVTGDDGDVAINTGSNFQGPRYRERFEELLGRPLQIKTIVLTQNHFDHSGGWSVFADPGVETIVQRNYPFMVEERTALDAFFQPRRDPVLHAIIPSTGVATGKPIPPPTAPEPLTLFGDHHAFEVSGRRFEVFSAPSGETLDSLFVWLPEDKVIFTGNWMGALYGALPHFYTLRGDRDRSVPQFIRDAERILDLAPELLITGHDEPIVGQERIRKDITKLLDAVRYIHDETVKGMSRHEDLFTLMREVKLPAHLEMAPGRGPVSWYVRAVWEEYTGWFRQELTSELYAEPPSVVWSELAEMAGGAEALATRAQKHLAAKEPARAMHLIEIALHADPKNQAARQAEIEALEQLIELTEGKTFDELCWLEYKLKQAHEALG